MFRTRLALVLVGLVLGSSGAFGAVDLTSDLILLVFLPPLLFEGALEMDVEELAAPLAPGRSAGRCRHDGVGGR